MNDRFRHGRLSLASKPGLEEGITPPPGLDSAQPGDPVEAEDADHACA